MIPLQNQLQSFKSWKSKYLRNKLSYGSGIWEDIGNHPQDILFLELGIMYIAASQELRLEIKSLFDKQPDQKTRQLVLFIRRIAKIINSNKQTELIEVGLAIADITTRQGDLRDILISVAILKYGAERIGIDTTTIIEDAISNYSTELRKLLQNFVQWSEIDLNLSIKWFGPEDWVQNL